jgi:hypothetical protein
LRAQEPFADLSIGRSTAVACDGIWHLGLESELDEARIKAAGLALRDRLLEVRVHLAGEGDDDTDAGGSLRLGEPAMRSVVSHRPRLRSSYSLSETLAISSPAFQAHEAELHAPDFANVLLTVRHSRVTWVSPHWRNTQAWRLGPLSGAARQDAGGSALVEALDRLTSQNGLLRSAVRFAPPPISTPLEFQYLQSGVVAPCLLGSSS